MFTLAVNAIVRVDGDNVDQALKLLKKKIEREGLIREIYYEKPTEVRRKKLLKARRKQQKLQRKLQKSYKNA